MKDINRIISEAILNDVYLKNMNIEKAKVYNMCSSPFISESPNKRNVELMIDKMNLLIEARTNQIISAYENSVLLPKRMWRN